MSASWYSAGPIAGAFAPGSTRSAKRNQGSPPRRRAPKKRWRGIAAKTASSAFCKSGRIQCGKSRRVTTKSSSGTGAKCSASRLCKANFLDERFIFSGQIKKQGEASNLQPETGNPLRATVRPAQQPCDDGDRKFGLS